LKTVNNKNKDFTSIMIDPMYFFAININYRKQRALVLFSNFQGFGMDYIRYFYSFYSSRAHWVLRKKSWKLLIGIIEHFQSDWHKGFFCNKVWLQNTKSIGSLLQFAWHVTLCFGMDYTRYFCSLYKWKAY
jgi:hypothetical protein